MKVKYIWNKCEEECENESVETEGMGLPLPLMSMMGGMKSSVDYDTREILINGDISANVIEDYVMPIIQFNKDDNALDLPIEERQPITLYINCVGGDITNGNNLVDIIMASKTPIHGIVLSYAYSMGVPILLACHKKFCYSNSTFLIHDGGITIENSGSKAKDVYKYIMMLEGKLKKFILARTRINERTLERNWRSEWYFDSEKALEYGVIDEILTEIR